MGKRWKIARQFGVDLTVFDDSVEVDDILFKTSVDKQ